MTQTWVVFILINRADTLPLPPNIVYILITPKTRLIMSTAKTHWMNKAKSYIGNSAKMFNLVSCLKPYLRKGGLEAAKEDLKLLMSYVADVATGRYRGYHVSRLIIVIAALVYVLDPADIIPDFFVCGFVDDATVIGWAISKVASELQDYKASVAAGVRS